MKLLSKLYKELNIDFTFPIEIKNSNGNITYYENSKGFWEKHKYDSNGKETYYEDSGGVINGTKSCDGKIIKVDGKKYKLTSV